jgi:hypothetical protein
MAVDDSYTKALLHFDGSDESATFTDESGKTWTGAGTAQLDTAQKKFGTASLLLDGDSDYISTPDHADFDVGSGDFTIDFWVRFNAVPGAEDIAILYSQRTAATSNDAMTLWYTGLHKWYFSYSTNGTTQINLTGMSTHIPSVNTWYHVACVRNGSNLDIYIDGSKQTTKTISGTIYNSTATPLIGATNAGTPICFLNGWIDEFRFSKGIARWTANFTPQSEEYYIEGSIIESAVVSDAMVGIAPTEYTTESAGAMATFDGYSLSSSTTESAEATDTFGTEITSYGPTTESATATDSMDALHLVDSITESAVVSDAMEAAEIIRKRIRFPNLQGKHLSLKFTSATDGSFAIYYLRHKMFKTRELTSDQKHPNTQGSHIGIKLSNSGSDAFTLMYVSEKMQLVTT